ncbi:MAG: aldehyde dehydrogenase family protein, partial [Candidatus Omnitrophica bacterium]|nr:aldehyde dehydrogenase family protein [Candidatus Omnitrophota bacterium]
ETLLVHQAVAKRFLTAFGERMERRGVELRGCAQTRAILKDIKSAHESDWSTEYLGLILSVKVVKDLDEAVGHIRRYGSGHSDAIVSRNAAHQKRFAASVDSACVFINTSTRFADGGEFGMGAEMGISTDKLHARGPVGVRELTTYKYVVTGRGQIRG